MNAPELCPDEEICSEAWEEIQASKPRVPAELLRKYHNCRIKHRVNDEKPELFRPRCAIILCLCRKTKQKHQV